MTKNILLVTYAFHPMQAPRSFRATELAKEFVRQGHKISVIGPKRDGVDEFAQKHGINYIEYNDISWKIPQLDSNSKFHNLLQRVINRSMKLLFEYPQIQLIFRIPNYLNKISEYDALISIAVPYPVHWAVARIWNDDKKNNPAKLWVADCGDPYCLQENDTFRPPFYFRWIEKWFCSKTDYITVPTENSIKGYFPEFHKKIKVIPQGFQFKKYHGIRQLPDNVVHFVYGGAFIPGRRDPTEMIEFLNELPAEYNFQFDIYTSTPQFVKSIIKDTERIKLYTAIPRDTFMEHASGADFVVNFSNAGTVQTPSKIVDYGILNKPILNIETGKLNKEKIIQFLTKDFNQKLIIDNVDQYRIENVAKKFLQLIETNF